MSVDFAVRTTLKAADQTGAAFQSFDRRAERAAGQYERLIRLSGQMGRAGSRAVIAGARPIAGIISASSKAETAMARVAKTTGLTGEALKVAGKDIAAIGQEIPVALYEIAGAFAVGGQYGVATEMLSDFSRHASALALAADDLSGTAASEELAKISQYARSTDFAAISSIVAEMGNSAKISESQMAGLSKSMASAFSNYNGELVRSMALGAAFAEVETSPDFAESIVSSSMKKITNALTEGGAALQHWQSVLGMTPEAIKEGLSTDGTKLFERLIKGLAQINDPIKINESLTGLGIKETRQHTHKFLLKYICL